MSVQTNSSEQRGFDLLGPLALQMNPKRTKNVKRLYKSSKSIRPSFTHKYFNFHAIRGLDGTKYETHWNGPDGSRMAQKRS